jgi:hypothetical protein
MQSFSVRISFGSPDSFDMGKLLASISFHIMYARSKLIVVLLAVLFVILDSKSSCFYRAAREPHLSSLDLYQFIQSDWTGYENGVRILHVSLIQRCRKPNQ